MCFGNEKDATLVYGFNEDVNKEIIKEALNVGNIEKYLNKIKVKKGDTFLINAGTIHAIGEGILIAEIQENSNLTYRVYDYNRTDKKGNKRELHIDKALEIMNYKKIEKPDSCKCKYFDVNKNKIKDLAILEKDEKSFHVLLCIEGKGYIEFENEKISFIKGDCIFVPANAIDINIEGNMEMLNICC